MPAFILLVSIITSCCYASEQQQKTITIHYPGHTSTITIPLDQQQKLKKSITINTFRPYDKAVEQAFSSLFQSQRKRGLLTSIKGSLQQDSFWELVDRSETASIAISSEDSVLKIDRGKKPAWYRLLPNNIAQDISETLDDVITDLGERAIIPIAITDSIALHSSAPLDFLIHAAKLMYDNKDKENLAGIIKSQAAYVKASVAQMQQALLWAQQLRLRQKYLDILVDIYADRLLHTDFTNIPQNIVMSGLPATLDLDKLVAKNLMLRILGTYFSSKDKDYSLITHDLSMGQVPENIEKIILKKVVSRDKPFLFLCFDTRSELLVSSAIFARIALQLNNDVVDAALSESDANKMVSITNNGKIDLYSIQNNNVILKNSFQLPPQKAETNAAILYRDQGRVYVGFGQSLHVFDIVQDTLKTKQRIPICEVLDCHITYLSPYKDVMAITYLMPSGEYAYKWCNINDFIILDKKPDNAFEVILDAQYENKSPITEKKMVLIGDDCNEFCSFKEVLKTRGFDRMHSCYDMIIDAQHKKIYTVASGDVIHNDSAVYTLKIRAYDIIPAQLSSLFNALNQHVREISSEVHTKKRKTFLTLDLLSLVANEYPKVGSIKIAAHLKRQISSRVRATMPSGIFGRVGHYIRNSYFSLSGHTKHQIKEAVIWTAILGGILAIGALFPTESGTDTTKHYRYY